MIKVISTILEMKFFQSNIVVNVYAICCAQPVDSSFVVTISDMSLSEDAIKSAIRASIATQMQDLAAENGYSIVISEAEVRII